MTPPEVEHGKTHGLMLNATRDTMNRLTTLPRLMVSMLREDGWRVLSRPIDGRVFKNETIDDWVLGEPWAGLHFPDWATAYALLERNLEVGPECIERLQKAGAPKPSEVEAGFKARVRARVPAMAESPGNPTGNNQHKRKDGNTSIPRGRGSNSTNALRRLKRDRPELAAQVLAGELSAHAAAVQAGFRKSTWSAPTDVNELRVAIERRYPGYTIERQG
jgi:hypothetical protein